MPLNSGRREDTPMRLNAVRWNLAGWFRALNEAGAE